MIEKLDVLNNIKTVFTADNYLANVAVGEDTINKINELVDAVNGLQKDYDNICVWVGEQKLKTPAKNVQNEFAEQCKWRGKLCKFWNSYYEPENVVYGVLRNVFDIYPNDCPFQCENGAWYEYCEPVSEDLFYKTVRNNKNVK